MVRTIVAHTHEIDDVDLAVAEMLDKLDIENNLLKNSVGIISCHYEFVLSGVVEALCGRLPFDVAGIITLAQAENADSGLFQMTLMLLTSDDVRFETGLTDPLLGAPSDAIGRAYDSVAGGEKPSLIFSFAAFLIENSGDEYVEVLTKLSDGAPVFGTLSVDDTVTFEYAYMIYNGNHYRDRMGLILAFGDIKPKFFIATMSKSKMLGRPALITSSEGHILKEVNGRPLVEYFEEHDLTKASETSYAMTSVPFMLDYNDGTPMVSKIFIGLNENKHAICAGAMPEGSTLYIGIADKSDVLLTTREAVKQALSSAGNPSGMLMFSCVSRMMTLGADNMDEIEMVREIAGDTPFMAAYSGGEICPTHVGETSAINRFHNNTFILCTF